MNLAEGDLAVIEPQEASFRDWRGFKVRVLEEPELATGLVYVHPLSDRPDGYGRVNFYWVGSDLRKLDG